MEKDLLNIFSLFEEPNYHLFDGYKNVTWTTRAGIMPYKII